MARSKKIPGLQSDNPEGAAPDAVGPDSSDADPPKKKRPNRSRLRYRRRRQRTKDTRGTVPHRAEGIVEPAKDLPTIARAVNEEWLIPERIRTKLIENCERIHEYSDDDKIKLLAAKIILLANGQNLKRQEMAMGKPGGVQVNVVGNATVTVDSLGLSLEVRKQIRDALRQREAEQDAVDSNARGTEKATVEIPPKNPAPGTLLLPVDEKVSEV